MSIIDDNVSSTRTLMIMLIIDYDVFHLLFVHHHVETLRNGY